MAEQQGNDDVPYFPKAELEDTISLNMLSDDDLSYIASNPDYRAMLQDLLLPYIEEKRASADHASTSGSKRDTDTTRPDLIWGREAADQRLTDVEDSADNTASILQSIGRVMRKRTGGQVPLHQSDRDLTMLIVIHSQKPNQ
jgi:hypothetical protein